MDDFWRGDKSTQALGNGEAHCNVDGSLWRHRFYGPRNVSGGRAEKLRQFVPFEIDCSSDL